MVRHLSWALGVSVLLMSAPASFAECLQQSDGRGQSSQPAAGAPQQPRPRFWTDPKLRQELGITDQQSAAIEEIFSKSIQSLRDARKELDRLEAVLSQTIQENTAARKRTRAGSRARPAAGTDTRSRLLRRLRSAQHLWRIVVSKTASIWL